MRRRMRQENFKEAGHVVFINFEGHLNHFYMVFKAINSFLFMPLLAALPG